MKKYFTVTNQIPHLKKMPIEIVVKNNDTLIDRIGSRCLFN